MELGSETHLPSFHQDRLVQPSRLSPTLSGDAVMYSMIVIGSPASNVTAKKHTDVSIQESVTAKIICSMHPDLIDVGNTIKMDFMLLGMN